MANTRSPYFFVIIGIIAICGIISALGAMYYIQEITPPKIVDVKAKFSGTEGDLIVVHYQMDKPARKVMSPEDTYIIVDGTNKTLGPLVVPKIGVLLTQTVGKNMGWFVADNGNFNVVNGTKITIVLNGQRFENFTMIYDPNNLGIA